MNETIKNLEKRGFNAHYFKSSKEAKEFLLKSIDKSKSVGIGGSTTITQLELIETLKKRGNELFYHSHTPFEKRHEIFTSIIDKDVYICSANALSKDGRLWFVDGTGNRLSAICYGPKRLYVICGKNKIVKSGYENAIQRIKTIAAPLNCKRLNLNTKCAVTGKCVYEQGTYDENCICNMLLELGKKPNNREVFILLINESLGY